ncbi:eCIS core domain-containing protein [Actinokineospora sp.]|uniref:eCIS core domain-containing protein n=1 Tax=Actinokineospora sp. TaxID=1872133 RepID=UPI003D6ACF2C
MRWPFRRASHTTAPAPAADPPQRARGEWVLVPPMPTTFAADAPLVTGPAPVQPPLPGRTAAIRSHVAPPVGGVEGIARALPLPATRQATEPLPQRPKVRKARPVGQLTEATDEYVGPAREPAQPYRAPGWMRYVPEWMQQTTPEPDPVPPTPSFPSVVPDRPLSIPSNIPANPRIPTPDPVLPPRVAEIVRPAEPLPPARRRPSLGQTRRLGLGSPVSRPADEPFVPPAEPPMVVDAAPEEPRPPAPFPAPPPAPPPLVFRAGATPLPRVTGRIVRDEVPPDLAGALKRDRGADVSAVPVFRGPAVDAEAHARGARAFAKDGAVFLPESAGTTSSAKAKSLLAHELVHVVQQRTLGSLPALSTPEGRRLEAEAVAAEGQYGGLTDTPLIHPPQQPQAAEPTMSGPAQLAPTVVTPPDPAHSHFEREAREEIDQIAESTAHRVLEEWTPSGAQGGVERRTSSGPRMTSGLPTTGGGAFGDTVGFTERRGADATSPTSTTRSTGGSGTFDRAARRQEMETELLDALNAEQAEQGGSLISHLGDADIERIERALDREEQGGGRASSSTPRPVNPEEGGAFGDTVSFTQRSGDDLRDPRARQTGQTAQGAASRLSLAAALSASSGTPGAAPSRSATGSPERISDAGGTFGDTVSFSEPMGDDRFRGGRRPDSATSSSGRAGTGTTDMHGTEEEPVDLDRVDMEDLTARLYDRVRSRLRLELLVDRERSGRLTDFT